MTGNGSELEVHCIRPIDCDKLATAKSPPSRYVIRSMASRSEETKLKFKELKPKRKNDKRFELVVWSSIQIMRGTSSSRWECTCFAARGNAASKLPAASFFFTWRLDRWFRGTMFPIGGILTFSSSWIMWYVFLFALVCAYIEHVGQ